MRAVIIEGPVTTIVLPPVDVVQFNCTYTEGVSSWEVDGVLHSQNDLFSGGLVGHNITAINAADATGTAILVLDVVLGDSRNGSVYVCKIIQGLGDIRSDPAFLLVAGLPEMVFNLIIVPDSVIVDGGNVNFMVYWGEPFNNFDPIISYTIRCDGTSGCVAPFVTSDNTTRNHTFTSLPAAANYTFTVFATNSLGNGMAANLMVNGFSGTNPTGGADPHFVCPLKNGQSLCFSVQGEPDFIFNLFSDLNIQMNAKFASPTPDESRYLVKSSTFIQQLGLMIKEHDDITHVKISSLDHSVMVQNTLVTVEDKLVTISIINGSTKISVTNEIDEMPTKDETNWVDINSDIGFALKVKFVKNHLDMIITKTSGLTKYVHGIQGQFMGHDALIDTENQLLKIGDNPPFPIKEDGLWPYLNLPGKCWYAVNAGNQGERILEGTYTDYIVEDLFSTSFKYNKF
ncbi:uncharacterized protein [Dysidea avara]|uniref:uncharacterized protein n=1 Tax=Dysidea avara TaxID=196820 RepID=UPI0033164CB1